MNPACLNTVTSFFFSSHLKASSKRGHPTTFQRETRYRHTHANTPHTTQHTDRHGHICTHTYVTPTQGPFRAGPLHGLSLQGGRPLHPSRHPALTSAHLTGGPGSQGDTQRWTRGQRDHGCDRPLIKGPSVNDANRVRG